MRIVPTAPNGTKRANRISITPNSDAAETVDLRARRRPTSRRRSCRRVPRRSRGRSRRRTRRTCAPTNGPHCCAAPPTTSATTSVIEPSSPNFGTSGSTSVELEGVEAAGDPGDRCRDAEHDGLDRGEVHAHHRRRGLVVAGGDHGPADAAAEQARRDQGRDRSGRTTRRYRNHLLRSARPSRPVHDGGRYAKPLIPGDPPVMLTSS